MTTTVWEKRVISENNKSNVRISHRIAISRPAFAVVAKAIHNMTIETGKFQSFRDVIRYATEIYDQSRAVDIDTLPNDLTSSGTVTLSIKLDANTNHAMERIKKDLTGASSRRCGAADAMVFCALIVANSKISACI